MKLCRGIRSSSNEQCGAISGQSSVVEFDAVVGQYAEMHVFFNGWLWRAIDLPQRQRSCKIDAENRAARKPYLVLGSILE